MPTKSPPQPTAESLKAACPRTPNASTLSPIQAKARRLCTRRLHNRERCGLSELEVVIPSVNAFGAAAGATGGSDVALPGTMGRTRNPLGKRCLRRTQRSRSCTTRDVLEVRLVAVGCKNQLKNSFAPKFCNGHPLPWLVSMSLSNLWSWPCNASHRSPSTILLAVPWKLSSVYPASRNFIWNSQIWTCIGSPAKMHLQLQATIITPNKCPSNMRRHACGAFC